MFSNFIFILPFEFPYCFASSIYLQLETINNAPSKQSNPDIKLTYAQLSLQVLLFTFKAMFLHNLPIIPYCSHIQRMYNQLSWVSVPLHFLPHCLGSTFTPFHLVIYLLQVVQASAPASLLKSTLPPLPCHQTQDKCLSSLPPQPSVVCVQFSSVQSLSHVQLFVTP